MVITPSRKKITRKLQKGEAKEINKEDEKIENIGRIVGGVYHVHYRSRKTRGLLKYLCCYSFNIKIGISKGN